MSNPESAAPSNPERPQAGGSRIGLGIVGLGIAANLMLPSFVGDKRIRLVGVADVNRMARDAFAAEYGVPSHAHIDGLLTDSAVNAIYIATPHEFHVEQAIAALNAGKHVLVEKPLALSVDACLEIAAASRANGVSVVVGHTHAFDRPVRRMHEILVSGRLGRVAMIHNWTFNDFLYRPRRPEELDTSRGCGIVFNQIPHQVDVARLLGGGSVRSVRSSVFTLDPGRPTEGSHTTFMEFENGAVATLSFSGYDYFNSDELYGWVAESGRVGQPRHGESRRARNSRPAETELDLRHRMGYQPQESAEIPSQAVDEWHHPHFGLLLVNCEKGDLRATPNGLKIYEETGVSEISIPPRAPFPDRGTVVDDLYRAAVLDKPSVHDAEWGAATMEVCQAILTSSRERREVVMAHQVATDPSARGPAAVGDDSTRSSRRPRSETRLG